MPICKASATSGVDMSEDMLTEAMAKTMEMENPPRFVCQRLEQLWLPRGVDLAVCALDIDFTFACEAEMLIFQLGLR